MEGEFCPQCGTPLRVRVMLEVEMPLVGPLSAPTKEQIREASLQILGMDHRHHTVLCPNGDCQLRLVMDRGRRYDVGE